MARYATISNVTSLAIPAAAIASISDDDKNACLDAASSEADTYIGTRHAAPLETWPLALQLHVAKMAVFHMMAMKGYKPGGYDELIRMGYEDGKSFLKDVAAGRAILAPTQTTPSATGKPSVSSEDDRGFGSL